MAYVLIAAGTTLALCLMALLATVPTYYVAPAMLVPALWLIYALRRRLCLSPGRFALLCSALLLHMLGAFGFYQSWPLPFSFDILVHFYFALAMTPTVYHILREHLGLRPRPLAVITFLVTMGLAALHELMEYGSYLLLGEQRGMLKPTTSYFFDTQRDLTNNLLGALAALAIIMLLQRKQKEPHDRA